ncbi:GNAT family N-acetyltransferase [Pseudomonas lactucae]|uniref:GNAT family N-acetyltransferase n=1 Tax=Pseudomonas lactucae TaxID=2813360 RepID=A0A9X0YCK7_9PSED|nr:N-acetyltransferase [Pseudomonas lactucae]MBN2977337.1 GNAT family N-acetyltransferase [Pseudomonas lactucae]MBN2989244.1 GNAT family N-acetyltransferase [Pseudomonas lactucae]
MINIRAATQADLDTLRAVGCETYREHFSTLWSPAGMQDFLSQDFSSDSLSRSLDLPDRHSWLIASDEDGTPLGFSKVNWSTPAPITEEAGAELQKIYFLKSAAGRGYGKQLLQFICDQAVQRGEHFLWLDVLKSNSHAQRFYQGFGFRPIGELPFSTDLEKIGMVVMGLELNQRQAEQ